jgi:hypothetical protein
VQPACIRRRKQHRTPRGQFARARTSATSLYLILIKFNACHRRAAAGDSLDTRIIESCLSSFASPPAFFCFYTPYFSAFHDYHFGAAGHHICRCVLYTAPLPCSVRERPPLPRTRTGRRELCIAHLRCFTRPRPPLPHFGTWRRLSFTVPLRCSARALQPLPRTETWRRFSFTAPPRCSARALERPDADHSMNIDDSPAARYRHYCALRRDETNGLRRLCCAAAAHDSH